MTTPLIYNPARHMERFDPRGEYVPELRDVPDEYLREPWTMPDEVQKTAGCVIGEDYPEPIVNHRETREEAFARYRV
jgi:deoxyribodipyrimidine photo-lyase